MKTLYIILALIIMFGIIPITFISDKVQAAGTTTVVISYDQSQGFGWYYSSVNTWTGFCTADSADTGSALGIFWLGTPQPTYVLAKPGGIAYRWNLSTIPADAEIVSAKIIMYASTKTDTSVNLNNFQYSYYKTNPGVDMTLNLADNGRWYTMKQQGYGRMTAPKKYTDTVIGENEFIIGMPELALERYAGSNYTYMQIMTEYQGLLYQPPLGDVNGAKIEITQAQPGYPKLSVTYVTKPVRGDYTDDLHVNAPVNTTPIGNEVASNITLETLTCMYGDETLSFNVNGQSGANVSLELLDKNGIVIDQHNDSIRTDNIYSWQLQVGSTYNGFVRVHEKNFNLYSSWVSVQPSPSPSQATNYVYAGSTNYPQYTNPFSSYVVYDNDLMYVHWKTNLDPASELSDYGLQLMSNGNRSVYKDTLQNIATNYYGGLPGIQNKLSHWRYMVFTPAQSQGQETYSDIVYNLNFDSARSIRTGFIQAQIVQSNDWLTELATCHSAYWFLSSVNGGLNINLESSRYTVDQTPVINVSVGEECKVQTYLYNGTINIPAQSETEFIAKVGTQRLAVPIINNPGVYTVSVILDLSSDHSYVYRYDLSVTINDDGSGGGGSGIPELTDGNNILGLFKKILGIFDTSSESSHWILLIVGMGILTAVFWFSSVLRVLMPMLLFGAACVSGWIDSWWVTLLALGAGFWIYSTTKKKTHSEG